MGDLLQPTHLLIIFLIVLVLFGGRKLPELGKGLGEAMKGFREGIRGISDPPPSQQQNQQNTAPAPPQASNAPVGPKQG
jgi:sec-independent protein translocase protein TatA